MTDDHRLTEPESTDAEDDVGLGAADLAAVHARWASPSGRTSPGCEAATWARCLPCSGLVVLFVVFGIANDRFLSDLNIANLSPRPAPIIILAMGLVPVLLLGDIDLSAGVAGGVAACVMGLVLVKHEPAAGTSRCSPAWPSGALIGLVIGVLVAKLGIPSFVVTLAFFLGLQGVTLKLIGDGGTVRIDDPVISGIANNNLTRLLGLDPRHRGHRGATRPSRCAATAARSPRTSSISRWRSWWPQIVALAVILLAITYLLNQNRSGNPTSRSRASPTPCRWSRSLLILWTFILGRTTYGRHVYAVGGNTEAARRAGIRVDRIRISVLHHLLRPWPRSAASSLRPTAARCRPRPAAATCCSTRSAQRSSAAPACSAARARPGTPSSAAW